MDSPLSPVECLQRVTDKLNAEQLAAVRAPIDQPVLILAGAGTGKTTTALARVMHISVVHNVHSTQLLYLAYNKTAAADARKRLMDMNAPVRSLQVPPMSTRWEFFLTACTPKELRDLSLHSGLKHIVSKKHATYLSYLKHCLLMG